MFKFTKLMSFVLCMAFASTSIVQAWSVSEKVTSVKNTVVDAWKSDSGKKARTTVSAVATMISGFMLVGGLLSKFYAYTLSNENIDTGFENAYLAEKLFLRFSKKFLSYEGYPKEAEEMYCEELTRMRHKYEAAYHHAILQANVMGNKSMVAGLCLFLLGALINPHN